MPVHVVVMFTRSLLQAEFAGTYTCNVENTLEPSDGPKQMKTDMKKTVVNIVGTIKCCLMNI